MSESKTGKRRRSREEADRLVSEYEQSGLTRKHFCLSHGISKATLDNYRKRKASAMSNSFAIVPVDLTGTEPNSSACLWLELRNGRRIEVETGFDSVTLEQLIAVADRL